MLFKADFLNYTYELYLKFVHYSLLQTMKYHLGINTTIY